VIEYLLEFRKGQSAEDAFLITANDCDMH